MFDEIKQPPYKDLDAEILDKAFAVDIKAESRSFLVSAGHTVASTLNISGDIISRALDEIALKSTTCDSFVAIDVFGERCSPYKYKRDIKLDKITTGSYDVAPNKSTMKISLYQKMWDKISDNMKAFIIEYCNDNGISILIHDYEELDRNSYKFSGFEGWKEFSFMTQLINKLTHLEV